MEIQRSAAREVRKRPTTVPFSSPNDRYVGGIWGTRLRHAALAVLIRARGEPVGLSKIWIEICMQHIVRRGVDQKTLADALRHECRRGRAQRIERGHYAVGSIAPRTRRRILAHERELRWSDHDALGRALQVAAVRRGP